MTRSLPGLILVRRPTKPSKQNRQESSSCHYRVQEELPKTNNSVEGWHESLQSSLGFHHPDPYRLIAALKAEQRLTEQKKANARCGAASWVSKPVDARIAEHLQAVLIDCLTMPLIDTLLECRFAYEMWRNVDAQRLPRVPESIQDYICATSSNELLFVCSVCSQEFCFVVMTTYFLWLGPRQRHQLLCN